MRPLPFVAPLLLLLAAGCGDPDEEPADPASCQDYETVSLGSLAVSEWPEGMADALAAYEASRGAWRGESCDDGSRVDLHISGPSDDALRVVRATPDRSAACGCLFDPAYGPDNHLQPLALIPDVTLQFDGAVDPSIDGSRLSGVGALFASGGQLAVRYCGMRRSDPVEGSDYDDAHLTFRLDANHNPSATITLIEVEDALPPRHCELQNLR